jgi:5-methylcytosine-specific restriction enzyme A
MNFSKHLDYQIFIAKDCTRNPRRKLSPKRNGEIGKSHGWRAFEFIRANEGLTVAEYHEASSQFNREGNKAYRHLKHDFERGRMYLQHPKTDKIIWHSSVTASQIWSDEDLEVTADPDELAKRVRNLRKRALSVKPVGQSQPRKMQSTTTSYYRDPHVKAWVLENAKGICELCNADAPFIDKKGFPFLEVHHVHTLKNGGSDTIENAVALCPNCHRRCHHAADKQKANDALSRVVKKR